MAALNRSDSLHATLILIGIGMEAILSWPEMQTAIHSREEKGRMIAEKNSQIVRMDENAYKVSSQSGDGMYSVLRRENGSWICSCFGFYYRGWCAEFP
jgi:hypothetical protein